MRLFGSDALHGDATRHSGKAVGPAKPAVWVPVLRYHQQQGASPLLAVLSATETLNFGTISSLGDKNDMDFQ